MIYLIIVAFILGGIFYSRYMMKMGSKAESQIDMTQERTRYSEYLEYLLNNDLNFIQKWMKDEPINAVTTVEFPQTASEKAKQMAMDGAKSLAYRAVGVKRRVVQTPSFAVMSDGDLHIMTTDVDHDLKNHYILGPERLQSAKLTDQGPKIPQGSSLVVGKAENENVYPHTYILEVDVDGKNHRLELYDRINSGYLSPAPGISAGKERYKKLRVVGEGVVDQLKAAYPNIVRTAQN